MKQIVFLIALLITLGVFAWSVSRIIARFRLTRKAYPVRNIGKRIWLTIVNGFLQERIFRNRIAGFMHALVFWGFCVILLGSLEMVIDGLAGTERILAAGGVIYDIAMALGDISAYVIALFIVIFIIRRCCLNIKRLHGKELSHRNHQDAYLALSFILILMITLAGMNIFYLAEHQQGFVGRYPASELIAPLFYNLPESTLLMLHEINWWAHILLIFVFANVLPYSKHFHIFMSLPNVFFSRLTPLGKLANMENITREVKIMLCPEVAAQIPESDPNAGTERFGVLDIEDVTWKNYIDSLACTQCGRCSSVCPANITGKELSPRKLFMDIRKRMNEKAQGLIKEGKTYTDGKSLIRDYISEEEIWACTTCNACAKECPLNIDHPTFIIDMRRYLVMEESAAPAALNSIFSNIENNGAPWQYSREDRMKWAE
jgi:heterodisulfide reductase subunit C/nitrate reductase gamma subunit